MVHGRSQLELHQVITNVVGPEVAVYFQPPNGLAMQYPCVVYSRSRATTNFANNLPYRYTKSYQVTVIDRDPDSPIPDKIASLPTAVFDRFFPVDDLNHDVFNVDF